ncbi:hypothetical protein QJS04_geneDACA008019 [Acorus gramineus]|uniref:RNA polymerase-associated protein LEO1 n=1 Tax=Acorus gramineus TaxID=55184 RepID=A0AAV9BAH3_ACOGR|nr:hypothetical protein QJS04_geneDACA008019 [Acorus gramineus]
MMQNLFGDQSEEEEEEEEEDDEDEVESGNEGSSALRKPYYHSEEGEGELGNEDEGEGEGEVEGDGEAEADSEAEMHDMDPDQVGSEGERPQSSHEREGSEHVVESEGKGPESEEEDYGERVATSRRRNVVASESERSDENHYASNEDEVDQARRSSSPGEKKYHIEQSASEKPELRDVFGDSDEDELVEYGAQNELEQDSHRSPIEEEGSEDKNLRPEDIVPDEGAQYESEEEIIERKSKVKPVGPPLDLEIPLRPPPGHPDKMNMIKVSNIMGIERKPFDPKTYVEEDVFVMDESGARKRIRLEDNIVRWRSVRNRDGSVSMSRILGLEIMQETMRLGMSHIVHVVFGALSEYESNARFVRWSDGSLQLLIGNEVLDINVQEAQHDQAHLFLRHDKGILQSQGRLLRKMRFMPSSLTSKSHRLLTALVDSRHKKVYKVKNCITDIDPEKEKEEKEKAEEQSIKALELIQKKREKMDQKNALHFDRGRRASQTFLEDALEEDDEYDNHYESHRASSRRRFEEDVEVETQSERRLINAKRSHASKDVPRKTSRHPVEYSESEREESEYESESEEGERLPSRKRMEELEHEEEDDDEEQEAEEAGGVDVESEGDEEEEPRQKSRETARGSLKRKGIESDEESPPRKAPTHRRMAVVFDSDED